MIGPALQPAGWSFVVFSDHFEIRLPQWRGSGATNKFVAFDKFHISPEESFPVRFGLIAPTLTYPPPPPNPPPFPNPWTYPIGSQRIVLR